MTFCKSEFFIIKSNYFQNAQKSIRTSARTAILRTSVSKWPAKGHFEGSEFNEFIVHLWFKVLGQINSLLFKFIVI
jgi:hypothetical protein